MVPPSDGPPDWWVAIASVIGLIVVVSIGVSVYRAARMANRGQNPVTLPEDLAWQAQRSAALRPSRTKAERLAEIDSLHASGSITDTERDQARARIIAE